MHNTLDVKQVQRAFARAATSYDAYAVLQTEVGSRLQERLDYFEQQPTHVLDLGCGTGRSAHTLHQRYRQAHIIGLDLALPMLNQAIKYNAAHERFLTICANAEALPLPDTSVDLIYSNLCLQWCNQLDRAFDELRRVLKPQGLLLFTTFGPDTLYELRSAFAKVDSKPHVSRFIDMHHIGDALLTAGFRDPVVEAEHMTLTYPDALSVMRELKALGATNADIQRARTMTGKSRLKQVADAYEPFRTEGCLPATYEVIYAHAWGPEIGQPRRSGQDEIASFPIDRLRGSRVQRK